MSPERDSERLLHQWLDEGPTRAADRLLDTVEERIDRQRQRSAWRLTWRNLFMNRMIGSFAAGAAVVAVALIGYNVLAGQGKEGSGVGAPSAPAAIAPSPTPTPTPAAPSEPPPAGGGLTVSFTTPVPEGWEQGSTTVTKGEDAEVEIFEDQSVMSPIPACVYGPAEGVGRTASEFVSALASRDGLEATGPEPAQVGGLSGERLEYVVAEGWTDTCPWWEQPDVPFVPTYGEFDEKNYWLFHAVQGDERHSLYVFDAPSGGNVIIDAFARNAEEWDANENDIESIVSGIQFDTGS